MSNRFNIYDEYREKFYRLPKVFFTNEKYIKLSNDAKMAWAILQDRLDLSRKNGWIDKDGDYFFIFTNEKLGKILNCGNTKVTEIKKLLVNAELLDQIQRGQGKPNLLYLNKPDVTEDDVYEIDENEKIGLEASDDKEVRKTNFKKSGKRISRSPENESLEVRKTNTNDTDSSNTDFSHEEEEEIKNARTISQDYNTLIDFLKTKSIDNKTINLTIRELLKDKIKSYHPDDVLNQYNYMMDKIERGEVDTHNNFAAYFVYGLKKRINTRFAKETHQKDKEKDIEMKRAQEEMRKRNNDSVYFDWLNKTGE